MKRKLLFAALCVVSALGLRAQTDVTDTYLVNPSFETLKASDGSSDVTVKTTLSNGLYGWEVPSMSNYQVESQSSGSSTGFGSPVAAQNGTYYYFNRHGWANKNSELKTTTKAAVPVGRYYAEIYYKAADYSNNNNANNNGTTIGITVKSADNSELGKTAAVRRSYSITNSGSNPGSDTYIKDAPWSKIGVYFEVKTATVVTISLVQNMKNSGRSDILWDNLRLYNLDEVTEGSPLDVTGFVPNSSFEAGQLYTWSKNDKATGDTKVTKNTGTYVTSGFEGNYLFNTWNGSSVDGGFYVQQTLNGLPSGLYRLTASVASDAAKEITLTAGETEQTGTTTSKESATNISVQTKLTSGSLLIKASSASWFKADNFRLEYLRPLTASELTENVKKDLLAVINDASEVAGVTSNVGEGVFQTPTSAVTALNGAIGAARDVYDNVSATVSDVETAIDDLETAVETYKNSVNPPVDGARYYLKVATPGHAKGNNAIVVSLGATSDNNKTGYGFAAAASPVPYMAQAFIFTQVSGNSYKISVERPEGTVYLTYGSLNGSAAGWKTQQIQGTTDADAAGEFKIVATTTANVFNIVNTVFEGADNYVDCQEEKGALYTDTNIDKKDFTLAVASKASVDVNIAADKYATRIFPFTPSLPSAIKAYSCAEVSGSELTLVEEPSPVANTPYILYSESGYTGDALTGWGTATANSYGKGLLTGVYTTTEVPADSYVLQTLNEKQAFYQVYSSDPVSAPAYRAYLTVDGGGDVKAFFFNNDDTDDINSIENAALTIENATIYNLAGQRINKVQKGVNIINGKKYMVK